MSLHSPMVQVKNMKTKANLAVIILTYNEERNIAQALDSVRGWAKQVIILDSFSTDRTLEAAKEYDCDIFQNPFEGYPKQRNYALDFLPITTEWVLFLDADEWLHHELKQEISELIESTPEENGFYIKRRLIWMGRWIRRGYYPIWILRLFRHGKGRCGDRSVNEHIAVEGKVGYLKNDFFHEDRKDISDWILKHNRYATKEAEELVRKFESEKYVDAKLFGNQVQRKRWLRYKLWNNLPPLIRPFLYFVYRLIIKRGFLDGREAFIFHFLQGLWFPLLIDIKFLEAKRSATLEQPKQHGNVFDRV